MLEPGARNRFAVSPNRFAVAGGALRGGNEGGARGKAGPVCGYRLQGSRALAEQQESRGIHSDAAGLTTGCITGIPNRKTYDASSIEASHNSRSL